MLPSEPEPNKVLSRIICLKVNYTYCIVQGRLLVFNVANGKLNLVTEKDCRGAIYSALPFSGGKLLISVNSKIQIFRWQGGDSNTLKEEASRHGHMLALYVRYLSLFSVVLTNFRLLRVAISLLLEI